MDGEQLSSRRSRGDACATADERLALPAAGQGDDDPLPRLPRAVDALFGPVPLEGTVDFVGQPEQCQLAQGGQVAEPEIVGKRGVDSCRGVDLSVGQTGAQCLGRQVDDLDLVGGAHHRIGNRLVLQYPGDLFDHIVERLDVLDVDGRHDIDPCIEHPLDILPPLLVDGAGCVGVRELVDQRELGAAREHGIQVELGELDAAVADDMPGDDLQAVEESRGGGAVVGLDERDDDILPEVVQTVAFLEHREGLADAGRGPQHDA